MGFRAAQLRAGQQVEQRPAVKHAQNMFVLTEAAAEMGADHLANLRLVADQLHQQIFGALLLQRETSVATRPARSASRPDSFATGG